MFSKQFNKFHTETNHYVSKQRYNQLIPSPQPRKSIEHQPYLTLQINDKKLSVWKEKEKDENTLETWMKALANCHRRRWVSGEGSGALDYGSWSSLPRRTEDEGAVHHQPIRVAGSIFIGLSPSSSSRGCRHWWWDCWRGSWFCWRGELVVLCSAWLWSLALKEVISDENLGWNGLSVA